MAERRPSLRMDDEPLPVTATVAQFSKISGLGKTSIYEMINSGQIRSVRICGRRLIVVESWVNLVGRTAIADRRRSLETALEDVSGDG